MATKPLRELAGVVVSAGKMLKTVRVRLPKQEYNKKIHKVCGQLRHVKDSPEEKKEEKGQMSIQLLETSRQQCI